MCICLWHFWVVLSSIYLRDVYILLQTQDAFLVDSRGTLSGSLAHTDCFVHTLQWRCTHHYRTAFRDLFFLAMPKKPPRIKRIKKYLSAKVTSFPSHGPNPTESPFIILETSRKLFSFFISAQIASSLYAFFCIDWSEWRRERRNSNIYLWVSE